MKNASATLDRIQVAKRALIDALRSAESELPASHAKQLDALCGKLESLQAKIATWAAK